jgi:hypothetical protein
LKTLVYASVMVFVISCSMQAAQETPAPTPKPAPTAEQEAATLKLRVAQLEAKLAEATKVTPEQQTAQQVAALTKLFQGAPDSPAAKACKAANGRNFDVIVLDGKTGVVCSGLGMR